MENLAWLGLFSDEKIQCQGDTAAAVLEDILKNKLKLPIDGRDMVAIVHEMDVEFSNKTTKAERITSTFIEYGETGGYTAISKTVGLPAAIASKLILSGELPLSGCHIPTHPAIYSKVLPELKKFGLIFVQKVTDLEEV